MRAGDVRKGDTLQTAHPRDEKNQEVLRTELLPGVRVLIVTDKGSWTFGIGEPIRFPRRESGEPFNWLLREPPMAGELRINDLVPAPEPIPQGLDPRLDPDWDEYTEEDIVEAQALLLDYTQRINSIARSGRNMLRIGFYNPASRRVESRVYLPKELVQFPDDRPIETTAPRRIDKRDIPRSGQYRNNETGALAQFAIPKGRGRYPAAVKPYDPKGSGLMSPPRAQTKRGPKNNSPLKDEWAKWTLVDGSPHPGEVS